MLEQKVFSQQSRTKKEQLQNQYKKIVQEIEEIQASLNEAKKKKTESTLQLQSLDSKIKKREILLSNINGQLRTVDDDMAHQLQAIHLLEKNIDTLKKNYAKIIYSAYKRKHTQNDVAFIFSSKNFTEAWQRIKFLKSYSNYQTRQAQAIQTNIDAIYKKIDVLRGIKEEKTELLVTNKKQAEQLVEERKEKDALIDKISKDIAKLRDEVRQKNKAAAQLNNQIQNIIQEEMRKERERQLAREREEREREKAAAEAAAKEKARLEAIAKNTKKKKGKEPIKVEEPKKIEPAPIPTLPEKNIAADFAANKGSLPWPVAKGYIVEEFGRHPHPSDAELLVENNGVDIKTSQGAEIRSVFKGKVISILYLPNMQNSVIIKHGDFFTVYSHLDDVYVKEGESVDLKESLGRVHYDAKNDIAVSHIEIWHGQQKLDPKQWLADK